jgi:hypothetical protein
LEKIMAEDAIPTYDSGTIIQPATAAAPVAPPASAAPTDAVPSYDSGVNLGSPMEVAKTAVEQGLSGASLGLSKVAETKLMGVKPEMIKARAESNPATAIGSNILGTGAMLYGTGGLGGLAEGAGLLTKIGVAATEGAAIGGINQATDDWSENKPLDAQKIAANAGIGALLGGGLTGVLEGARPALNQALDFFGNFAPKSTAEGGAGIGAKIVDAYNMAASDTDKNALIKNMTGAMTSLRQEAIDGVDEMYSVAGQKALGDVLNVVSPEVVTDNVNNLRNQILEISNRKGSYEAGDNVLSERAWQVLARKQQQLHNDLKLSESNLDTHNLLTDFATDVDSMIKWEGKNVPTDQGRIDQSVLREISQLVRGNLKDTSIWGNAGQTYSDLSAAYKAHVDALKVFDKAFTANYGGKRVIDPGKISAFLSKSGDETQALKAQALNDFIKSSTDVANTTQTLGNIDYGTKILSDSVKKLAGTIDDANTKARLLKLSGKLNHGHSLDAADFILFEMMEGIPGGKPAMAAYRMLKKLSPTGIGQTAAGMVKMSRALAEHAQAASKHIDRGAKAIFSSTGEQD